MQKFKLRDLIYPPIAGEWGTDDVNNEGVFVIRTTNFTKTGKIDYSNLVKRKIETSKIPDKKLVKDDIIIEKSGGGPATPVGRVVQFQPPDKETYLCNNFTWTLRPIRELVLPDYLFYQFSYFYQTKKVKKYQNQTIGIFNLNLDRYLNEEVVVPALPSQLKTIAQLNKIQALIALRKGNILNLNTYLRAKFQEIFGDPVLDTKGFGKKNLDYFGKWRSGGTPPRQNESFFEGVIPWFSSGELNNVLLKDSIEHITAIAIQTTSAKLVEAGSLLVGMYDTAALKSGIVEVDCSCNQAVAFSKLDETLCEPIFIYHAIQYSREYLLNKRKGARQKNFNLSGIKNIQIINPSLDLQKEFVKIFFVVYSLNQKMQRSLQQLEMLFQSFLHLSFNNLNDIDEDRYFEDILNGLDSESVLIGNRLKYLVNWYGKKNNKFTDFNKYDEGFKNILLDLLDKGHLKQVERNGVIKLKVKL